MTSTQVGIKLDWRKAPPTPEIYAWVLTTVEHVQRKYPDLHKYLKEIRFVTMKTLPHEDKLTEDQRFVLQFMKPNAHYSYYEGEPGWITAEYVPYVDIMVAIVLHELAHVIYRMENPDARFEAKRRRKRFDIHNPRWSQIACELYREFGCEKAGLIGDGMAYKSLRKRHALLLQRDYSWAYRVWHLYDTKQYGQLRSEFTDLFAI